jgi:lipoprotein-releasing system permease protein
MKTDNIRWIGFVAARYVSRRRSSRSSASPVFAVLGIFTGVLALTVILAVMNGFQLGFIETILEISSYHLRVELPSVDTAPADLPPNLEAKIRAAPPVTAAVPFREIRGILRGQRSSPQAAVIRALPPDALEKDGGMAGKLSFESGSFDLEDPRSILLGAELARRLSLRVGDELSLLSLAGFFPGGDGGAGGEPAAEPADAVFVLTGIFRSGFYEYDLGWGFINLRRAEALGGAGGLFLGIKLANRWQDRRAERLIGELLGEELPPGSFGLSSWRDYNRAFFGALRTEKLMMFLLVGLIFIVVGLNIFQTQRRTVLERREEIGLLRAVGASDRAVRLIFLWDGFIIGITGAGLGLGLGLLIAFHIGTFFSVLEGLVNGAAGLLNALVSLFGGAGKGEGGFAVFSPAIFYIKEIPSRVIPREAVLVFLFGFLSALAAAWFASGKVSRTKPAEVLRYE